MIRDFKFFSKETRLFTTDSWVRLRDIHNRQKNQFITWSEYPPVFLNRGYLVFEGNILEFYNLMLSQRNENNNRITPKIYEIEMWRSGYVTRRYGFSNHSRMHNFVSRAWKLKIHYNL